MVIDQARDPYSTSVGDLKTVLCISISELALVNTFPTLSSCKIILAKSFAAGQAVKTAQLVLTVPDLSALADCTIL